MSIVTSSAPQAGGHSICTLRTTSSCPGRGGRLMSHSSTEGPPSGSCRRFGSSWRNELGPGCGIFFFLSQTQTQLLSHMQTPQKTPSLRPFKQRKSLGKVFDVAVWVTRERGVDTDFSWLFTDSFVLEMFTATSREEVAGIQAKFPNKIPVRSRCTFWKGVCSVPWRKIKTTKIARTTQSPLPPPILRGWTLGALSHIPWGPTSQQVIVERYPRERSLPPLDKVKFLVPQDLTMSQFLSAIQ